MRGVRAALRRATVARIVNDRWELGVFENGGIQVVEGENSEGSARIGGNSRVRSRPGETE